MARSMWEKGKGTAVKAEGELELATPKEGLAVPTLQFKESLHLSALNVGWVHGQRGVAGSQTQQGGEGPGCICTELGVGSQD